MRVRSPPRRSLIASLILSVMCVACGSPQLRGEASPWTGNAAADLVTVRVHCDGNGPGNWEQEAAYYTIFDNGTIVLNAQQYAPSLAIRTFPKGSGTDTQFLAGNEVASSNMVYPLDAEWKRLPGHLSIRVYYSYSPSVGKVVTDEVSTPAVDARAGTSYSYIIYTFGGHVEIRQNGTNPR